MNKTISSAPAYVCDYPRPLYHSAIKIVCGVCKKRALTRGHSRDSARWAWARAVGAKFKNCIAAGEASKTAYRLASEFASGCNKSECAGDSDIADLLQIAVVTLLSSECDFKETARACNRYLNSLREERRAPVTENELCRLFARNLRELKRASESNIELAEIFDSLQCNDTCQAILRELESGCSRRECARRLDVSKALVNKYVQKVQKQLAAMPEMSKYFDALL